jgi:hypothetical protein
MSEPDCFVACSTICIFVGSQNGGETTEDLRYAMEKKHETEGKCTKEILGVLI